MSTFPLQWAFEAAAISDAAGVAFEASEIDLQGLADYAGVKSVTRFAARLRAVPLGRGRFRISGSFEAWVVQSSIVDLEPVSSGINESFSADYWPEAEISTAPAGAGSFETDPPEPIVGGRLEVGKLLCELFVLAINPYPRNEGDELHWPARDDDVSSSPFASLAQLKSDAGRKQN
jgi:hypothetical protein